MFGKLTKLYFYLTLDRPLRVLTGVALFLAGAAYLAQGFELDASTDSLILENDEDLRYYRGVRARYGADDFLVVTYSPQADLLSDAVLADIGRLRDALAALEGVASVTSLLDVPLVNSPRVTLGELRKAPRTLERLRENGELASVREPAREELTTSPLYRNQIVSADGRITALRVDLRRDERYRTLLARREALRLERSRRDLTPEERAELRTVTREFRDHSTRIQERMQQEIASVRTVLDQYRDRAEIHLGGVPMIASDMIDYVRSDIRTFGVGVTLFLIILLAVTFRRRRWVLLPLLICVAAVIGTMGFLGLAGWRVTVVSSNFISLLLITALALTVHMLVRYLELRTLAPRRNRRAILRKTIRSKFQPALYTVLTTQVAFASLIASGIRPVIDFGWMMVVGVGLAFSLCLLLFPASIVLLPPARLAFRKYDVTAAFTSFLARLIERFRTQTLWVYALLVILSVAGIFRLTVEDRFIDYFKQDTEIHQGMLLIDRQLGGTTPLDVIIGPDRAFQDMAAEEPDADAFEEDPLYQEEPSEETGAGISADSYWFNMFQLKVADEIHAYLKGLPETGKVLSISTTMALASLLNRGPLDNISLSVLYRQLPEDLRKILVTPYMSADGNQLRFLVRVIDSDPDLERDELIKRIRKDLIDKLGLEADQVRLSGMLVLYNNVLQSLFRSQILTLVVVFLAIDAMLLVLFRSWALAAIGTVPTMVAATVILGTMGWLGIPLDIMTITIAAISIGIGIDNTIHYLYRIRREFARDNNYWTAVKHSHGSVGRAIYYTSITVTLGFSILALSNFIPTIYFGLLTGLAMLIALIANLTLLPLLIVRFQPLGPETTAKPA